MRRLLVGIALFVASTAVGVVGAGVARADAPNGQLIMYVDYGDAYALASAAGCTPAATDDSCA